MTSLTSAAVDSWRLARQHLAERAPAARLADVVSDVCGVQAQVMSAAELSIWARVTGVRLEDVRDALWEGRSLLKTWMMRGTLHLLSASDAPLYVSAARTRASHRSDAWLRYFGLTLEEMEALIVAVGNSLDGRCLTREELADEIGKAVGAGVRESLLSGWGSLLKPAAFNGKLCFAPNRGRNVVFTRPDRWLSSWQEYDSGEALQAVLRRYLHAYGPSTREDFAIWWGTAVAPAGRLIASIADELAEVEVDGRRAWMLAADAERIQGIGAPNSVRLLPNFDVYVLGYRPRSTLVAERFADRIFRTAGWISPVVLVDGRVAGVWERKAARGGIEVHVELFGRLARARRGQIEEEAALLGEFLDRPARVIWPS